MTTPSRRGHHSRFTTRAFPIDEFKEYVEKARNYPTTEDLVKVEELAQVLRKLGY